jgi:hypothetical protein
MSFYRAESGTGRRNAAALATAGDPAARLLHGVLPVTAGVSMLYCEDNWAICRWERLPPTASDYDIYTTQAPSSPQQRAVRPGRVVETSISTR